MHVLIFFQDTKFFNAQLVETLFDIQLVETKASLPSVTPFWFIADAPVQHYCTQLDEINPTIYSTDLWDLDFAVRKRFTLAKV